MAAHHLEVSGERPVPHAHGAKFGTQILQAPASWGAAKAADPTGGLENADLGLPYAWHRFVDGWPDPNLAAAHLLVHDVFVSCVPSWLPVAWSVGQDVLGSSAQGAPVQMSWHAELGRVPIVSSVLWHWN